MASWLGRLTDWMNSMYDVPPIPIFNSAARYGHYNHKQYELVGDMHPK
jgi:hypothetical protein